MKIAIVGGGFVGVQLAKALEQEADVFLIEPRRFFVHTPAMIRAVVDPTILDQALIPYDDLLTHGTLMQNRARSVDGDGVTLEDGTRIEADYIVVATGSDYAAPFKPKGDDIAGLRAANEDVHARLRAADSIAIIGAGPVGVELSAEIAHFMPDKKVTLISEEPDLFPEHPEKLGRKLQRKLEKVGVALELGVRAENLESLTEPYFGSVRLSSGESVDADLVIPAIGARAVSSLLETLPDTKQNEQKRYRVDAWLRPSSLPNVFAAGDLADPGDAMTIVAASRQVPWLAKSLKSLIKGKKVGALKPYKPWNNAPMLVPLGPKAGNSNLVMFIAGDGITSAMKGKDLFLTRYHKLLGRK